MNLISNLNSFIVNIILILHFKWSSFFAELSKTHLTHPSSVSLKKYPDFGVDVSLHSVVPDSKLNVIIHFCTSHVVGEVKHLSQFVSHLYRI